MRTIILIISLSICIVIATEHEIFWPFSPESDKYPNPESIEWTRCWFDGGRDWPESDCGHLRVPENWDRPNGRSVTLPFIIFRTHKSVPGRVPVLVAGGGGPGNPLGVVPENSDEMHKSSWLTYVYMSLDAGRDLILTDNRGVGSSSPRLNCPEVIDAEMRLMQQVMTPRVATKDRAKAFHACKERLTDEGIDVSQYNNVAAVRDIDFLRDSLGLETLNIYGISYGTRIALTYLREFPESTRTLVLDSVDPPEVNFLEVSPRQNFSSLKRVFELCSRDSFCRTRHGTALYDGFVDLLTELKERPKSLQLTDPRNSQKFTAQLTPELLVSSIFGAIYDEGKIGRIPGTIQALIDGNVRPVTKLVQEEYVDFLTLYPLDAGAYASYQCYDEFPFNDIEIAAEESGKYPLQDHMNIPWILSEKAMCEVWDLKKTDPIETAPVSSNVPVLLYSGDLDPVTPPVWAREALRFLPNGRHRVWMGIGHDVMSVSECADRFAAAFLASPMDNPFRLHCVDKPRAIVFGVH